MSPALPKPGDRVRITTTMPDDPDPLPVGATGTVIHTDADTAQIIVDWDTNRSLILLTTDPFEVTAPTADTAHEAASDDTAASFRNWLVARDDARGTSPPTD